MDSQELSSALEVLIGEVDRQITLFYIITFSKDAASMYKDAAYKDGMSYCKDSPPSMYKDSTMYIKEDSVYENSTAPVYNKPPSGIRYIPHPEPIKTFVKVKGFVQQKNIL